MWDRDIHRVLQIYFDGVRSVKGARYVEIYVEVGIAVNLYDLIFFGAK